LETLFDNMIIQKDMKEIEESNIVDFRKIMNKTFLITGSTGMLPSYLVYFLIFLNEKNPENNIRIIAQARNPEKVKERFGKYSLKSYFRCILQDVCDKMQLDEPIDYIIHGASLASPQFYGTNPVETLLPNVLGTFHLLELAKAKSVQSFLFFSSGEVYGTVENRDKISEQDYGYLNPLNIRSCYGESKRMGENMCVSWYHEYQVPAKSIRIHHTYGPTMDIDNDKRVFSEFVANVVHKESIIMKSDGSPIRPFCYITDAVRAFLIVLLDGENGEAYNMGNPDCMISMGDLARELISIKPEYKLTLTLQPRLDGNGYLENKHPNTAAVDIDKIKKLGWEPKISIQEGFRRTVESLISRGEKRDEENQHCYSNL